jgi:cation diffusion facilitator family transporter
MASGTKTVVLKALIANGGIAISKFIGAHFSGSATLLAESVHSLVDCGNQVLLLVGSTKSATPPDERHPLGYGREAFFWSFVVSILLFSMGGIFAIYEGWHKLSHPGTSENISLFIPLIILLVSVALEAYSFAACIKEIQSKNRHGSLWNWFRRSTAADLVVIFMEDLAALLGLIIGAIFILLTWYTNNLKWDAIGSIVIGAVLVIVACLLAYEIKSLLVGEAPEKDYRAEIQNLVSQFLPSGQLLRLIALQTGSDEVMIACKVKPSENISGKDLIIAINLIEAQLKKQNPEIRWSFFEPDLYA